MQLDGNLFRLSAIETFLCCFHGEEIIRVMREMNEDVGGNTLVDEPWPKKSNITVISGQ